MINRIFISTNKIQWDSLFSEEDETIFDKYKLFKQDKFLNADNSTFTVEGVVFLFDGLENLPNTVTIIKETDLLVWHSSTKDGIKNRFTIKAESLHSQSDDSIYRRIFKILLDDATLEKPQALIRLFAYLDTEKTERLKTDFLYYIYNGKPPSSFKRLDEIPKIKSYKDLYNAFEGKGKEYNKQCDLDNEEANGIEQRKILSLLRDALLTKN